MKKYQESIIRSKPCKHWRADTDQCITGCKVSEIKKGNACPYEVNADTSLDEWPQKDCPCYM